MTAFIKFILPHCKKGLFIFQISPFVYLSILFVADNPPPKKANIQAQICAVIFNIQINSYMQK